MTEPASGCDRDAREERDARREIDNRIAAMVARDHAARDAETARMPWWKRTLVRWWEKPRWNR